MEQKKKKVIRLPSSFTIIFFMIVLIGVLTWFMPAGSEVIPATLADILLAPIEGFKSSVSIIMLVLVFGGFLKVINSHGAIQQGIAAIVRKAKGREIWIIPILIFFFSLGGSVYGMAEETLPLYPLIIGVMLMCGFDVLTAVSTILLGMYAGVSGATLNPFSVGTSIDSLESIGIPCDQGLIIGIGFVVWILTFVVSSLVLMRYAKRVKADPDKTYLSAEEREEGLKVYGNVEDSGQPLDRKNKIALILFAVTFVVMILGLVPWQDYGITIFQGWSSWLTGTSLGEWYYSELGVWFLIMTFVVGFVYRLKGRQIIDYFIEGAGELVGVAMIIGLAKGIYIIMANTGFDVYLLSLGSSALENVSGGMFAIVAYLLNMGFAILIPSTSGRAAAIIPTFGSITQTLGYAPEIMISILIGSQAIVGMVPIAGTMMAGLKLAKVEFISWLKVYWKVFAIMTVIKAIMYAILMVVV